MEVESDILDDVIECKTLHRHQPQFGERVWLAEGKKMSVLYLDNGNTWCEILCVIPKKVKTREEQLRVIQKFYQKLKEKIEKGYDEDGFRIL